MTGLGIAVGSGAALRELRTARGWSQIQLVVALEKIAAHERLPVAERASLKVAVSRWENGHQCPDRMYRHLLCLVYGVAETQLGVTVAPQSSPAKDLRLSPRVIGPEVVAYFGSVLGQYVAADQMLGPAPVRGVVCEQAHQLESVANAAAEPYRSQLLRLLVVYAEFAGWLSQDSGALDEAETWTARAGDLAAFVDDRQLSAYTAIRRAGIATEAQRPGDARGFAEVGLRHAEQLPPQLVALGARQLAQACALTHDEPGCRSAVAHALDAASTTSHDEQAAAMFGYCGPAYVSMETGASLAVLGDHPGAAALYHHALDLWPTDQQRDRGLCLARLTDAHAASDQVDEACQAGTAAADVLAVAPSARARAALRSARNRLHPHRRQPEVVELAAKLAAVV